MTTEERLERLEEELARVKRCTCRLLQGAVCLFVAGCVLAVILSTIGSAKAQGEKVIRANQFILEDQDGNGRAALTMVKDWPVLALRDKNRTRAELCVGDEGPKLSLYDQNGKTRAELALVNEGPALRLRDQDGKTRAALAMVNEELGLRLWDQNEKSRVTLGTNTTRTSEGKTIVHSESTLLLFGPEERVIWSAP